MAHRPKNPDIPSRNGVSPSCVAVPHTRPCPWPTVLDFLSERLSVVDRTGWTARLQGGEVLDDHGRPLSPESPCRPGERLYYYRRLEAEQPIPFEATVLFQDAHLLVMDKPHFLPVVPTGRYVEHTLLVRAKRQTGIDTLSPLHRIDRETAGIVVFSIRPQDRNAYQALFRDRAVDKRYEAIATCTTDTPVLREHVRRSRIEEDPTGFFRMHEVPGEPNSETRITEQERRGRRAQFALEPVTGKRHQLRVHMAALGLPLVGDQFYPVVRRGPDAPEDFAEPLRLLAQAIAFTDPVTGQARRFESGRALEWPTA